MSWDAGRGKEPVLDEEELSMMAAAFSL